MKNKFLATFEVIGILVIGWTLTRIMIDALGVPPLQEYLDQAILSDNPEYLNLSKIGFITLLIQFLCLMIPAFIVTRLLHKRGLREFGITRGTASIWESILSGVLLFCLFGIPMKLLLIVNHYTDLGVVPEYWELFNKDWNFGFWLFMAVGSFVVIPVFEELFYRGYAQFRFEKDFKFFAIFLISFLFIVSHFQYFIGDLFNIGMLISLFLLSFGMAFLRYYTASIIAPIVIHSLMNIPTKIPYDYFVLALMILIVVLFRKRILSLFRRSIVEFRDLNLKGNFLFLVIVLVFAAGMMWMPGIALILFIFLLILSVSIQIVNKRKDRLKVTDR